MSEYELRISLSTAALQAKYLALLQRLLDVLTVNAAGAALVTQDAYESFHPPWTVNPAENRRLAFDDAKAEAERWNVRNVLQDAVETIGVFLDEARVMCGLYALGTGKQIKVEDYNRIVDTDRRKFHQLGLPLKISRLRDDFGVESDWDEHVLSLNRARNCFVHRLGVVPDQDIDANGELTLVWKAMKLRMSSPDGSEERSFTVPDIIPAGWTVTVTAVTERRTFRIGDRLVLTWEELMNAMLSLMHYVINLPQSMDAFSSQMGIPQLSSTREA